MGGPPSSPRGVSARMLSVTSARSRRDSVVRTSSYCSDGACVGVAIEAGEVTVVDTKCGDTPALRFTPAEWAAFVAGVKAGEFDLPGAP
jgi:hypothetical protein